jgi:hypothetical protein
MGKKVWSVTIEVWDTRMTRFCHSRAALDKLMDVFITNDVPFEVSWHVNLP